jgi:prenyltransferase beta subunit
VKLRNAISGKYQTIIVVMLMGLFLVAATDKKNEKSIEFDFKKTSAYIHEMDTRPDFPVSVILARNYVYSVPAIGETIDPKLMQKTINFVKNLQRPDGGFSVDFPTSETSSQNTDFALEVLSYLGAVNAFDAGKVESYLSSLKNPDGGFSFNAKTKSSSLQATYDAVHALSYLNGLDIVDKTQTAAYIKGFEKKDTGGFNYVKGVGTPTVTSTYMAVFTLKALGMLDDKTKMNAIKFLSTTPYMGKKMKYDINQTLQEQAFAIITLKMLRAEKRINKAGAVEFIKGFYIPINGGFGPIHGYGSAPDPTYFGIQSLAELGVLKNPNEARRK